MLQSLLFPALWRLRNAQEVMLVNNIWSDAGPSEHEDINLMTLHYFVNYTIANGWYSSCSRSKGF